MTLRKLTTRLKPLLAPAVLLAGVALTGCTQDQHKFRSSEFEPKTVHVFETASQELLWTYEIPVGHDLVITLKDKGASSSVITPYSKGNPDYLDYTLKSWENGGWDKKVDSGRVDLTGNGVTLELEMRPAPEAYKPFSKADADDPLATPEADAPLEEQAAEAQTSSEADPADAIDETTE